MMGHLVTGYNRFKYFVKLVSALVRLVTGNKSGWLVTGWYPVSFTPLMCASLNQLLIFFLTITNLRFGLNCHVNIL